MNVSVVLFKKEGTYFSKTKNKDVPYTNFFLRVNAGSLIPIEVKYFKKPQLDNRDPGFQGRVSTLSALAFLLRNSRSEDGALLQARAELRRCRAREGWR